MKKKIRAEKIEKIMKTNYLEDEQKITTSIEN